MAWPSFAARTLPWYRLSDNMRLDMRRKTAASGSVRIISSGGFNKYSGSGGESVTSLNQNSNFLATSCGYAHHRATFHIAAAASVKKYGGYVLAVTVPGKSTSANVVNSLRTDLREYSTAPFGLFRTLLHFLTFRPFRVSLHHSAA
jgi:hypothetical protein